MSNIVGKVVMITGASAGIGKATALELARAGCNLVLCGRRENLLQEVSELALAEAKKLNMTISALPVATDVTDEKSVTAAFAATVERFGRLDVLFNNAGVFPSGGLLEDLPLSEWRRCLDVNLTGAFICTQEAFKVMKNQEPRGGRIINNGSISAHNPRPNSAPYTATKHALTGLTKSTSLDGRKYDIACGQIDIGNAATEMTSGMSRPVPQANGTRATEPTMDVGNVARSVRTMIDMPLDCNVLFMTVMATKMPLVGRG